MMESNWLKLETIQDFWGEHKSNREQLIEWEKQFPQHKDSIVLPLKEVNESLERKILDLFSYVETTIRIRSLMPDGETSVILDERFSKETAAYATLKEAMSNLRGEVKAVKECLDDPLDSVRKLQLNLEAANTDNEELRQNFRDLEAQYTELESCFYSRGGLEGQIKVLESGVKEKDKEIARISQQNNELRNLRSPQKITDFDSADDLTISQESNIIGKLEKEKRDLLEQLQLVTRERDGARKHKELMQGVYKSKEDSRKKLQEENNTLCKQVASLKAQRQLASPASLSARSAGRSTSVGSLQLSGSSMTQVAGLEAQRLSTSGYTHIASRSPSVGSLQSSTPSTTQVPREQAATNFYAGSNAPRTPVRQTSGSFGNLNFSPISPARNNNRQISSASPFSRTRPILTRTQERVMAAVQHLPDDHLEALESGGAFKSVEKGYHWVKAHWRRNPGH